MTTQTNQGQVVTCSSTTWMGSGYRFQICLQISNLSTCCSMHTNPVTFWNNYMLWYTINEKHSMLNWFLMHQYLGFSKCFIYLNLSAGKHLICKHFFRIFDEFLIWLLDCTAPTKRFWRWIGCTTTSKMYYLHFTLTLNRTAVLGINWIECKKNLQNGKTEDFYFSIFYILLLLLFGTSP